jgi:hypothetical protein
MYAMGINDQARAGRGPALQTASQHAQHRRVVKTLGDDATAATCSSAVSVHAPR